MKKIFCSPANETHFKKKVFTLAYPHMLFHQEADTYLIVILSKYFSASLWPITGQVFHSQLALTKFAKISRSQSEFCAETDKSLSISRIIINSCSLIAFTSDE